MALTDADRLQMVAIALMKHSVIAETAASGGGFLILSSSFNAVIPVTADDLLIGEVLQA